VAREQALIFFTIAVLVLVAVAGGIAAFADRRRARDIEADQSNRRRSRKGRRPRRPSG
jgi:hypothetical protein